MQSMSGFRIKIPVSYLHTWYSFRVALLNFPKAFMMSDVYDKTYVKIAISNVGRCNKFDLIQAFLISCCAYIICYDKEK